MKAHIVMIRCISDDLPVSVHADYDDAVAKARNLDSDDFDAAATAARLDPSIWVCSAVVSTDEDGLCITTELFDAPEETNCAF